MSTDESLTKNRKTPGVYITEINAFPPSVVGVATAVPAFIGYTQQGTPFKPVALTSLTDFTANFGTAPNTQYDLDSQQNLTPATPKFNLAHSLQLFYANGGGDCYVISVGDYSTPVDLQALLQGLEAAASLADVTLLAIPEAILLPSATDFATLTQAMLDQAATLQNRLAIFDIYDTLTVNDHNVDTTLEPCITRFQDAITNAQPSYGAVYFPFLNTSLVTPADVNYTNFNPKQPAPDGSTSATMLQAVLTTFNTPPQSGLQAIIDALDLSAPHDDPTVHTNNAILTSSLPQYKKLLAQVAAQESRLPPGAAMAGLYNWNDQNRGVWNAPANEALNSTLSLTVNLNDDQQGSLNTPLNGKAICALRTFPNQGPIVWGARTLDGNSADWRYIQVRRTLIYIEQSIKQALNQFVFAANDGTTWVTVTSMISNFLTGLWSQGGLMGDKASDAFTVQCGIPATMTSLDVLNGYMVVQVTLQMIRPAEFIELTFKQTMQGAS